MPLETTSLFLGRQILYLEISQFEIITRAFKIRTTIWYDNCIIRTMYLIKKFFHYVSQNSSKTIMSSIIVLELFWETYMQ